MKQFNQWLIAVVFVLANVGLMATGTSSKAVSVNPLAPAEDCASATPLNAGSTIFVSLLNTVDSVWFEYTPTENGYLTVSSAIRSNGNTDTRLFLFKGACSSLATVATSDNAAGLAALVNDVPVEANMQYYVLWVKKSTLTSLDFEFYSSFVKTADYISPANDNICNATSLTLGLTASGDNEDATVQGTSEYNLAIPSVMNAATKGWQEDNQIQNSVWFKFVAPSTGSIMIELANTTFDAQLALYSGVCTNIAGLNLMSATDIAGPGDESSTNFCVTAGQTYFILVDGYGVESGTFDITVSSVNIDRPFTALLDVAKVFVNGALCPGAANYDLTGSLVVAADSSAISNVDYVNGLTYSWTNSSNAVVGANAALTGRKADMYTVKITDVCGTVYTKSVTLTDTTIAALDLVLGATSNPTCVGGNSGKAVLTHTGGYRFTDNSWNTTDSLMFSYRFNASPTATSAQLAASPLTAGILNFNILTQLPQGSFRFYVEDACGNIDSVSFSLVDPASIAITLDSVTASNPVCPGSSTGSFDLFATGGEGQALTYDWKKSSNGGLTYGATFATTQDLINIGAGTYRVVVSDPCMHLDNDTLIFTLVDPVVANLAYTSTKVNPTSFTANNGSINITVTGGLPNYTAMWTVDGKPEATLNNKLSLTNLHQGIYHVTITDECTSAGVKDTTFVLLAPIANDVACSAISIAATDTLITYHNIGANAGDAVVIPFSNDEGYTGWADVNLNNTVWFKFVAPASGAVSLEVNHFQGLNSNLNFDPQVAVISASACAGPFNVVAANDNRANGGSVNDAFLEVFCLNPGQTYYVLVDGYQGVGAEGIFSLNLDVISVAPMAFTMNVIQPNCISGSGSIEIDNVTGGVYLNSPEVYSYSYSVNGGTVGTITVDSWGDITSVNGVAASSLELNNLTNGTYNIAIFDVCADSAKQSVTIAPITFTPFVFNYTLEQPYCPGYNSGEVSFNFTGGGTPGDYVYTVFDANHNYYDNGTYDDSYANEVVYLNGAGLYFIKVEDLCGNANTKEFAFELTDRVLTPFTAEVVVTSPTCPMTATGSAKLNLTGGRYVAYAELYNTGGYVSDMYPVDTTYTFGNLPAESYTLYVYDDCNGDTTIVFNVVDPTAAPVFIKDSIVNPTVNNGTDGMYSYTVTLGYPDYTVFMYKIGAPNDTLVKGFVANEGIKYTINNLGAGSYYLGVNDACGATLSPDAVKNFTIVNPPVNNNVCDATALTLGAPTVGTNLGAGVQPGEVLITPSLNKPCNSFEGWCFNNGIDASVWYSFTVPASGSFNVLVSSGAFDPQVAVYTTDNCANFSSFTFVAANDDKSITPLNQDAYVEAGCLTPGSTVYVLVDAANAASGSFTITASDMNSGALALLGNVTNATNEASANGAIDVLGMGGVKPYTFVWNDGTTTEDRSGLKPGTYTVTITDKCGATATKSYQISYSSVSNDNVCNAKLLPADSQIRHFNNSFATVQPGELAIAPNAVGTDCFGNNTWCNNDGVDGTVWFKFIAPSDSVTIDLCNNALNAIDPQLAVYSAALCADFGTFTMLGANDDSPTCSFGSVLSLGGLTPCNTYYIMVDSEFGASGEFGIAITDNKTTLNAGNDNSVTVCQNSGNLDLATLISAGADTDGKFSDDDDTQALGGSLLNTGALTPGTYHFTYLVADSCNGQIAGADYATMTVIVKNCTGINETAKAGSVFNIYPNPNNGIFTIENTNSDKMDITVFDITGKVVYNNSIQVTAGAKTLVDLNNPAKGVYTIRINGQVNGAEVRRVVVQ